MVEGYTGGFKVSEKKITDNKATITIKEIRNTKDTPRA